MFDWLLDLIADNKDFFNDPFYGHPDECKEFCNNINVTTTHTSSRKMISFYDCKTGKTLILFSIGKNKAPAFVKWVFNDKDHFDKNIKYPILDSIEFSTHAKYNISDNRISIHDGGNEILYYEKETIPFTAIGEEKFLMVPFNMDEDEYFQNMLIYDIPPYSFMQDLKKLGTYTTLGTKLQYISFSDQLTNDDIEFIISKIEEYNKNYVQQINTTSE